VSVPLVWRDVLADSARREAQQAYIESLRPDRDVAPRACKSVDPPRRLAPAFGGKRLVERDRLLHKSDSVIEMVISAMGETQQQVSTRQRTKPKSTTGRCHSPLDSNTTATQTAGTDLQGYAVMNVVTGETVAAELCGKEAYRVRDARQAEALSGDLDLNAARFAVRCAV